MLRSAFEAAGDEEDLSRFGGAWRFENILSNSLVEQQLFDCKQGLLRLKDDRALDEGCFSAICKALSAMANSINGGAGYIMLGVADNERDASRVEKLDASRSVKYRRFHIVGLEREARVRGVSLNDYWGWLIQRIRDNSLINNHLATQTASTARLINYSGLAVGILKVEPIGEPCFYGGELYERSGSETRLVPKADYMRVFRRFMAG